MILSEKQQMLRKLYRQFAETEFTDELLAAKPYLAIAQYEGANTALVRAITRWLNMVSWAQRSPWSTADRAATAWPTP